MTTESNLDSLHEKAAELTAKALTEVRQGRINAAEAKVGRFRTAEYLLVEAEEYVSAALDMLKAGRTRASLTVSRWVLEAALNLSWVTAKPRELDERLRSLVAEGLRLGAVRFRGLAELYPGQAKQFKAEAEARRQASKDLLGQAERRLDSLDTRVKSIQWPCQPKSIPDLYALYRVCCGAAHPGLELERRFDLRAGGVTVTRQPPDQRPLARFIWAASTLWLVSAAYCLTDLGDTKRLTKWWKDEMAPLVYR